MATARAQDIKLPTQTPDEGAPGVPISPAGSPSADPFVAQTVEPAGIATAQPADDGWGVDIILAGVLALLVLLALAAARILRLTEALRVVHEDELAALGEARELRRNLADADARQAELEAAHQTRLAKTAEGAAREHDELQRTNRLLQGMVRCDTVTGLANGPYLARQLAKELRRGMRTRKALSLLVCDIDAFDAYNQTHGHEQGDELLKRVGALLGSHFQRGGDLAARLDADRFVVIMPDTALADVEKLAVRLGESIRQAAIPHGATAAGEIVSVSFGIATAASNKLLHPHQLLTAATEALARQRGSAAAERQQTPRKASTRRKPARTTTTRARAKTAASKAAPKTAAARTGTRKTTTRKTTTRKKTARTRKTATAKTAAPKTAARQKTGPSPAAPNPATAETAATAAAPEATATTTGAVEPIAATTTTARTVTAQAPAGGTAHASAQTSPRAKPAAGTPRARVTAKVTPRAADAAARLQDTAQAAATDMQTPEPATAADEAGVNEPLFPEHAPGRAAGNS